MAAVNTDEGILRGWLAAMPREARLKVLAMAQPVVYPDGSEIMHEGDLLSHFGLVRSGRIALSLAVPGRGQVSFETVEVGEVFGLSALVPPHRATATAIAVADVEALIIDASALRSRFEQDCEFAASVYFAIARALHDRLEAAYEALIDLSSGTGGSPEAHSSKG